MFDIQWSEILVIVVVALIAIGPKDLPKVLFAVGKVVRRARYMASEFQHHFSDMMHEAELSELRRQADAGHDPTRSGGLTELIDPDGSIRRNFETLDGGMAGHAGSPSEHAYSEHDPLDHDEYHSEPEHPQEAAPSLAAADAPSPVQQVPVQQAPVQQAPARQE
ncbi:MAG: Sec-independent protein translocase protein TatB [Rhodospirillaceae bacterium]